MKKKKADKKSTKENKNSQKGIHFVKEFAVLRQQIALNITVPNMKQP